MRAGSPCAAQAPVVEKIVQRQVRIEKRPALRGKQGIWTLFGEAGQVLKRGQELPGILFPIERRLLKIVED